MTSPLSDEFAFYLEHQDELVKKYEGRFVVIKDNAVIGVYDDPTTAMTATQKSHDLGTFLVQKVAPGPEEYTQVFRSRVAFGKSSA